MASGDDLKSLTPKELSEENSQTNEGIETSIDIDKSNHETYQAVLASCDDSRNSASIQLELDDHKSNVETTSNQKEVETAEEEKKDSSCPVCSKKPNHEDRIEVIPDGAGGRGEGEAEGDLEGDPDCVHCQAERTEEAGTEEPDQEEEPIGYCERLCDYMKSFVDSWWMMGILAALALWGYSVVVTGTRCKEHCIFMKDIINLFIMVGGTGFLAAGTRLLVKLMQKVFKKNHFCCFLFVGAETFCFVWAYLVLLVFFIMNGDSPSTEQGPAYCDLTFYNFMVISTWVMLGVLVILSFIYVSAYSSNLFKSSSQGNIVSSSRYGATQEQ